jgi:hypothetical protein
METTETLYTFRLNEADAERVIAALRYQSRHLLKVYTEELLDNGASDYSAVLEDEYGIHIAIADDIEFVLPE